jgi:parallel beta-helix repeat protein
VRKPIIILLCMAMLFSTTYLAADTSKDVTGQPVRNENTAYNVSTPFRINSNAEFATMAASKGWQGDGSQATPYIIDNYDINGTGFGCCIYVGNTTYFFTIQNCFLHEASGKEADYYWNSGMILYTSTNGNISSCNISSNSRYGCYLIHSNDNIIWNSTISYNNPSDFGYGVYAYNCSNNVVEDCEFSDNYYGINFIYFGFDSSYNDNNSVIDCIFERHREPLWIRGTNTTVQGNNISMVYGNYGIHLYRGNNSIISDNMIDGVNFGNDLPCSIYLSGSQNITMLNNSIINGGPIFLDIEFTSLEHWNTHSIDSSNTIDGKPVYYMKNQIGGIVPSDAGQLILANCTDVEVANNTDINAIEIGYSSRCTIADNYFSPGVGKWISYTRSDNLTIENNTLVNGWLICAYSRDSTLLANSFSNAPAGLYLWGAINHTVLDNKVNNGGEYGIFIEEGYGNTIDSNAVSNSHGGIRIYQTSWTTLVNNTVTNNSEFGIQLESSANNITIYHNNLIDNGGPYQAYDYGQDNTWHNSYPSGGNYWSDYTGIDIKSGPLQNQQGSDGIGDSPYIIDADSRDNYPLMSPFDYTEINIPLQLGWNLISLPVRQLNESIDSVLESIAGKWDYIQTYDASDVSDHWKSNLIYRPVSLNDLTTMNHLKGYWINITEPNVTLTVKGDKFGSALSIPLYAGWNLVGYPTLNTTTTVANALWGTGADRVEVCDPTDPYMTKEVGSTYLMKPGEGYWVHVPADTIWTVNW